MGGDEPGRAGAHRGGIEAVSTARGPCGRTTGATGHGRGVDGPGSFCRATAAIRTAGAATGAARVCRVHERLRAPSPRTGIAGHPRLLFVAPSGLLSGRGPHRTGRMAALLYG